MPRTATPSLLEEKSVGTATATQPPRDDYWGDQCIVLRGVTWKGYVAINDAVVDPPICE